MYKRYYIDLTLDQSYIVAKSEREAIEKAKELARSGGIDYSVYDIEDATVDEIISA